MNSKKKFNYEYDIGSEAIIKSLLGKSYVTSKDIQRLFDILLRKTYETSKGKEVKY